ncbi:hypothetical protein [Streptomyces beigongshangae]|uniref:hypothetical protein n=1 Tax=Streptomyces beigongshangae TaxID=2841597 RepID=UPI0021A4D8A0|nr:hypothetical protein [Streptomyces sp. REN17]
MTGRMGRIGKWGLALGAGGLWWWAAMRLAFAADAGVLEGAVAAAGWGLSVLPVHCVPKRRGARGARMMGTGEPVGVERA